jgi:hypothetical protein
LLVPVTEIVALVRVAVPLVKIISTAAPEVLSVAPVAVRVAVLVSV